MKIFKHIYYTRAFNYSGTLIDILKKLKGNQRWLAYTEDITLSDDSVFTIDWWDLWDTISYHINMNWKSIISTNIIDRIIKYVEENNLSIK